MMRQEVKSAIGLILFILPASNFGATFTMNASAYENTYDRTTETVTDTTTLQPESIIVLGEDEEGGGKQIPSIPAVALPAPAPVPAISFPCKCAEGTCSCCTGNILQNFNINTRQKLCSHLSYDADDTTLGIKLAWNDRILYQNRISGKNPPPICVPIPPTRNVRACVRFNNIFFIGRNFHACVAFEAQYNKGTMFEVNFDCIRLGASGVSLVKPEEGGGLPAPLPSESPDDIEEYDENIGTTDKPPKKPKKPQVSLVDIL